MIELDMHILGVTFGLLVGFGIRALARIAVRRRLPKTTNGVLDFQIFSRRPY